MMHGHASKARTMHAPEDQVAIVQTLQQYCRGVDRRAWELVRQAYHVDAYDDHGGYKGQVPGLLQWLERRHAHIEQSMHFLGNTTIEYLSPTQALVETYCVVYQRYGQDAQESIAIWLGPQTLPEGQKIKVELVCRYIDQFTSEAGPWQILDRTVVMEEVKMVIDEDRLVSQHVQAQRDGADALWQKRSRILAETASA